MNNFIKTSLLTLSAFGLAAATCGCGDAAPTKAPVTTGPPHKKWAELTQEEKIKVVQTQPVPNKDQLIELIREGKK